MFHRSSLQSRVRKQFVVLCLEAASSLVAPFLQAAGTAARVLFAFAVFFVVYHGTSYGTALLIIRWHI
jgi:hypothetical protein